MVCTVFTFDASAAATVSRVSRQSSTVVLIVVRWAAAESQKALAFSLTSQINVESGVSIDEEMTNLLAYQRAYEAASRLLTTIDSVLEILINRTGLVGR